MNQLVVIGGGLAGAKFAERLREKEFNGAISVIAAEPYEPYERPPLSKKLLLGEPVDPTVLPSSWWLENKVELLTHTSATKIDRPNQQVELTNGQSVSYDLLVLATGARARILNLPGADRARSLRTVDDSRSLAASLTAGGRLVIVGAGWIGLEVAAAARTRGIEVTVLEAAKLPLANVLGPTLAQYLADLHQSHGVDLRCAVKVEEVLLGESGPTGVRTADQEFHADLVLIAAGATPEIQLATDAGLRTENGVEVDEKFFTSDPKIMAIGDVANAWHVGMNARLRVEHWDNAIRQGQAAAEVVMGNDVVYDWLPYFFTDQFEFSMEYVGRSAPSDRVEIRGDLAANEFIAYWFGSDDRLTAAMNVGIWGVTDRLRELVGQQLAPAALDDIR
ncbi:MAG TPA: FAD-dependent oxidoreductase [Aeromicrobium sp.]|nr:FAD-dependent oxidoreductase [Aeromicrobium sp.]